MEGQMITRRQWYAIAILAAVMALDAAISINGAWNCNATFYEANPLLAAFGSCIAFSIAVVVLKLLAIGLVMLIISILNNEPGIPWGDAAAIGGTFSFAVLFVTMAGLNLVI
jgi:hypothetical protein